MSFTAYRFSRGADKDFVKTLRQRVNAYFKDNDISKQGNAKMYIKTIFMVGLYFIPYFLMVFGVVESFWTILGMWVIMAFGMSGIGLSVMHDANHSTYSKNRNVNKWMSHIIGFVGGNSLNWQIQHNVLHHTYTNIEGVDRDLDGPFILRFSPHKKRYGIHKFQWLYAWFFYGLLTVSWCTAKEFIQLKDFNKDGLIPKNKSFKKEMAWLITGKVLYFFFTLVIPMIVLPISPWLTLLGFATMHFLAGLILSVIFQLAHVMPSSEYPLPNDEKELENSWAVHQLVTTTNFAQGNRPLSWFIGGLNYQVEHHLFPDICHVHYRKLSKIVKETAEEFQYPYYSKKTFTGALIDHTKLLYKLGRA